MKRYNEDQQRVDQHSLRTATSQLAHAQRRNDMTTFKDWYANWTDPHVGLVEDIPKRQGAKAAWRFQQARIENLEQNNKKLRCQIKDIQNANEKMANIIWPDGKDQAITVGPAPTITEKDITRKTVPSWMAYAVLQEKHRLQGRVRNLEEVLNTVLLTMYAEDNSSTKDHPWIPGHAAKPLGERIRKLLQKEK